MSATKSDVAKLGDVIPAGPNGWPPEHTIVSVPDHPILWWTRYIVSGSWAKTLWARLVTCRRECAGPFHDAAICLACGRDRSLSGS